MKRGDWETQRSAHMPHPPWPEPNNPILAALLYDARNNVADGMPVDMAMLQLANPLLVRRRNRQLRPRPARRPKPGQP